MVKHFGDRMRFSDRIGVTRPVLSVHLDSMPTQLRVSLWNLFLDLYNGKDGGYWGKITAHVAKYFRKFPADDLPYQSWDLRDWLKEYFFGLSWYEAYNFVEFIVKNHGVATEERSGRSYDVSSHPVPSEKLEAAVNHILEREHSGYRFIGHVLSPISEQAELEEVQKATELRGKGLEGARRHVHAALDLFSKRSNPDYRNAIKEAISAIESIAKQIGAKERDGLTPALRALEKKRAYTALFDPLKSFTDIRATRAAYVT